MKKFVCLLVKKTFQGTRHLCHESAEHSRCLLESLKSIDRSIALLETFLIVICVTILILAEVAAAVLREIFRLNFSWIEEFLKYLVIWVGLLGASLATQSGEHISIEVVSRFAGKKVKRFISFFINLTAVLITLFLSIAATHYLMDDRREYLSSGGRPRYLAFGNIQHYYCPDAENQKRKELERVLMQTRGYVSMLAESIDTPSSDQENKIDYNRRMLNEALEKKEALSLWKQDFLKKLWEAQWKKELEKDWKESGLPSWEKMGPDGISHEARVKWQTLWLSRFWEEKGSREWREAWEREGLKEWQEKEEESEFTQDEFQEEWKDKWVRGMWSKSWKEEMELAWKSGGAKNSFLRSWKEKWVAEKWKTSWKMQWMDILSEHSKRHLSPGVCKYCRMQLLGEPLKIPRWILLLILPIGLGIICLRFFIHFCEAVLYAEDFESYKTQHDYGFRPEIVQPEEGNNKP